MLFFFQVWPASRVCKTSSRISVAMMASRGCACLWRTSRHWSHMRLQSWTRRRFGAWSKTWDSIAALSVRVGFAQYRDVTCYNIHICSISARVGINVYIYCTYNVFINNNWSTCPCKPSESGLDVHLETQTSLSANQQSISEACSSPLPNGGVPAVRFVAGSGKLTVEDGRQAQGLLPKKRMQPSKGMSSARACGGVFVLNLCLCWECYGVFVMMGDWSVSLGVVCLICMECTREFVPSIPFRVSFRPWNRSILYSCVVLYVNCEVERMYFTFLNITPFCTRICFGCLVVMAVSMWGLLHAVSFMSTMKGRRPDGWWGGEGFLDLCSCLLAFLLFDRFHTRPFLILTLRE